jgi:hypothetical protein
MEVAGPSPSSAAKQINQIGRKCTGDGLPSHYRACAANNLWPRLYAAMSNVAIRARMSFARSR